MTERSSRYVHGTTPEEQRRLTRLNQLLNALVHARFLLEHLPDPLAAVRQMLRAVRPGGRVVVEDDDHGLLRLWPEPPGVMAIWRAYIRSYERDGNDPFVGLHVVSLLHQAGAKPVRNNWIFFGSCSGHPDLTMLVENTIGIFEGARESILATGDVTETEFDAGIGAFRSWERRPDAAYWFARSWAEGARPS